MVFLLKCESTRKPHWHSIQLLPTFLLSESVAKKAAYNLLWLEFSSGGFCFNVRFEMVALTKKKRVCLQNCNCKTTAWPRHRGAGAHRCPWLVSTVGTESRAAGRQQAGGQQFNAAGGG